MDETEKKKNELKKKISSWIFKKENICLLLILILAFSIRFYFFKVTQNQALWWDESEYGLKAKSFAFGTPLSGWAPEREVVIPFLFSLVLRFGGSEIAIRFLQVLMSFATVYLTYVLANKYLDKSKALLASFMMSLFWLHLFFSERILIYPWAAFLFLIVSITFYKGYFENKKKWLYIFGAVSAISLYTYFSTGFLLFGIFAFLLVAERAEVFKRKDMWITFGIFLLVMLPFALYSMVSFGAPIPRLAVGTGAILNENGPGLSMVFGFLAMMPRLLGNTTTLLFGAAALIFILELFIGFDLMHKEKNKTMLSRFFIFSVIFWTLAFYTFFAIRAGSSAGEGFYDGFILSVFPFIFAFVSDFVFNTKKYFDKASKWLFPALLVIFIILFSLYHINTANSSIVAKVSSYDSVREGGIWIKEHSNPGDIIVSISRPQNTYYSERETVNYASNNETEFDKLMVKLRPKYLVDSIWEYTPQWVHDYPFKHNDTIFPVQVYFLDAQKTQPSLIIYQVKY